MPSMHTEPAQPLADSTATPGPSGAIFKLGRISAARSGTNCGLLADLSDAIVGTLPVDVVTLAIFEPGIGESPIATHVRGPWTEFDRDRFLEQTRWTFNETALARRLSNLRRGKVYLRSEFVSEPDTISMKGFSEMASSAPVGVGDQAAALYRRGDGVELLIAVFRAPGSTVFTRPQLARVESLLPFVAQCWASRWRQEPAWMAALRPQSRLILDNLLQGCDDDQISQKTGLSYHSVRAHLKRLFREAGVRSRLHLMQACNTCGAGGAVCTELSEESQELAQATG